MRRACRLNWDASYFDAKNVLMGYLDCFEGIKEIRFYEWMEVTGRIFDGNTRNMEDKADVTAEELIPQHRIQYFKIKTTGIVIGDKRLRTPLVFGTGKPQTPVETANGETRGKASSTVAGNEET